MCPQSQEQAPAAVHCNVCGSDKFKDFNGRKAVMCVECFSVERTRCMALALFGRNLIGPGSRIFHAAPELGLSRRIRAAPGVIYEPYDFDPGRYPAELGTKKFDLVNDVEKLSTESYDLIIHSHVMEHIMGDVTATLFHLHRALKPSGTHVFCIPIMHGNYSEDLGPLTKKQREDRFGQNDHVRRFGRDDLAVTIGRVFRLPNYDIEAEFGADALTAANIPPFAWKGFTSHTIFAMKKDDIRLR